MSQSRARARRLPVLLAAGSLLATVACGSTAQPGGGTALGGDVLQGQGEAAGAGDGLGSDELGGVGLGGDGLTTTGGAPYGPGGSGGGPGSGDAGATAGAADSGGTSDGGSAAGTASGSAPASSGGVAHGPGVSATSVFIGIPHCSDCSSANAALGAGGDDPGDTRRYAQAAIDDVNARGGVLGRKLVPVFHTSSASQNIDSSSQAMCETWTKDNKVLIMNMQSEIVYECAKKAGAIAVGSGGSGPVYERYPNMFAPASIRLERLGAVTVKAMVRAGWHKPEPRWPTGRIGLITWENSNYRYAMEKGWLPALHGAGLEETEVRYVAVPQSDKSLADASAAVSAAVLAFREKGIDHVFISDGPAGIFTGVGLTFMFLNTAKSQGYYPRYGFNSNNSPGWENLPADQQSGMLAVDGHDTERVNDEGMALNPERERCWALMKKRGLAATDAQPSGNAAIAACDIVWFAEAVLKRAQQGTTLPQLISAAESLGSSYRSPYTYGTRLGPGRHDGAAFFRNARFDDACSCMRYTSKPYEP